MDSFKDYYQALGIERNASAETIEEAFEKLQSLFQQSGVSGDSTLSKKFNEIFEAHYVLTDPDKKSEYDQYYDYHQQPGEQGDDPVPQTEYKQRFSNHSLPKPEKKKRSPVLGCFLLVVIAILVAAFFMMKRNHFK